MRALIQRVSKARASDIRAPDSALASIDRGLWVLAGFEESDSLVCLEQMVQRIRSLRIFSDASGKMNLSGAEVGAKYLITSQFTLYAECKYGNRPSFDKAAPRVRAKESYEHFAKTAARLIGQELVQHTPFGSDLAVEIVNEGPVTIWLDSREVL